MAEINLSALFQEAFGYKSPALDPKFKGVPTDNLYTETGIPRKLYGTTASSPFYATADNGREYYLPVTISYPENVSVQSAFGSAPAGQLQTWDLPFPVVSIKSEKKIVVTELTERSGTVKELINTGSFEITVRGLFINSKNEMPEDDMRMMRKLYEKQLPLGISCALTDIFLVRPDRGGSDNVVIKSLELPEVRGVKNVIGYELKLVSDEPFNLEMIK
jgi:hypothetical protein